MYGVKLEFEGEFVSDAPMNLRAPTVAEFIPAAIGPCEDCTMEVSALDGKEEIALATFPVAVLPEEGMKPPDVPERYDFLRNRCEVDLSALVGRKVSLRWKLNNPSNSDGPHRAAILDYKLRLRQDNSRLPPILFICSDAHRYDYAFGERGAELMPRLNELRTKSVLYSRATSTASWTLPAITSVLTGLYPRFHRTGERVRETTKTEMQSIAYEPGQFSMGRGLLYYVFNAYPDRSVTIGEALGERGYSTALVVSNVFYVLSGLFADGHDWTVEAKVAPGSEVNAAAGALVERLPKDHPLFLLVHYVDVHEFMEARFKVEHPDQDPYFADPNLLRDYYSAAVRDSDRYLGELLDLWDREVGLDRSMVVFFSDHGEHLFDPGRPPLDEKYRTEPDTRVLLESGLLDHGNSMDEVLLHVPLLIKYPNTLISAPPPGSEVSEPVSLVDIYPTVMSVIGRPKNQEPHRGKNLLSLISEEEEQSRAIFHDYQLYGPEKFAVRRGDRKLVVEGEDAHLIDLSISPSAIGEMGQVVNEVETQKSLQDERDRYQSDSDKATEGLRSKTRVDKQQSLKDLEALGYLN